MSAITRTGNNGALQKPPAGGLALTGNKNYDDRVRVFNEWLEGRRASEETILEFFASLRAGKVRYHDARHPKGRPYRPASVILFKTAIKAAIRKSRGTLATVEFLAKLDRVFAEIKTPKRDEKVYAAEVLRPEEIESLISRVTGSTADKKRAFIQFLYMSGLRISEAVGLRVADCVVRGELAYLRITNGKGGKERSVKITRDVFEATKRVFKSDEFLIRNMRSASGRYTRFYWYRALNKAGAEALERGIGCHTFRHSKATNLLASGASLKAVSEDLGHSVPDITARYYIHDELSAESVAGLTVKAKPVKKTKTTGRKRG